MYFREIKEVYVAFIILFSFELLFNGILVFVKSIRQIEGKLLFDKWLLMTPMIFNIFKYVEVYVELFNDILN